MGIMKACSSNNPAYRQSWVVNIPCSSSIGKSVGYQSVDHQNVETCKTACMATIVIGIILSTSAIALVDLTTGIEQGATSPHYVEVIVYSCG
jgi:hypothetical protein